MLNFIFGCLFLLISVMFPSFIFGVDKNAIENSSGDLSSDTVGVKDQLVKPDFIILKEILPEPTIKPPTGLRIIGVGYGEAEQTKSKFENLNNQDANVRMEALEYLMVHGGIKQFARDIAKQLNNNDVIVRRHMAVLLANLGIDSFDVANEIISALKDEDKTVRLNLLAALGEIGPSVKYAIPEISVYLNDENKEIRANTIIALAVIGRESNDIANLIIERIDDESSIVRIKTCEALGYMGTSAFQTLDRLAEHFNKSNHGEQIPAAKAIKNIAVSLSDDDAVESVNKLHEIISKIDWAQYSDPEILSCYKALNRSFKYLVLKNSGEKEGNSIDSSFKVSFSEFTKKYSEFDTIYVNGQEVKIKECDKNTGSVYFLGNESIFTKGLNLLTIGKQKLNFWYESKKIMLYDDPYKDKSYAIIFAIDDYDRKKDVSKRGPTGYKKLDFMVENAKILKSILIKNGFPKNNIFEYYNADATKKNLENALGMFWQGAKYHDANRLIVYFGGHGDYIEESKIGYLITYDYDREKPTLTSYIMSELTSKEFPLTTAYHMLVLIDSCAAGLALPKQLGDSDIEDKVRTFKTYSIIHTETLDRARNILVAGTGEQKALWENGGIFTKALNSGLDGNADFNGDNLIQFKELELYIKNHVSATSNSTGYSQIPSSYAATSYGVGNVLFFHKSN